MYIYYLFKIIMLTDAATGRKNEKEFFHVF